jgi:hypothetical protein
MPFCIRPNEIVRQAFTICLVVGTSEPYDSDEPPAVPDSELSTFSVQMYLIGRHG